jgi:hypothetical protein
MIVLIWPSIDDHKFSNLVPWVVLDKGVILPSENSMKLYVYSNVLSQTDVKSRRGTSLDRKGLSGRLSMCFRERGY